MLNALVLTMTIALHANPSLEATAAYSELLRDHVKNGRIDYAAIQKKDAAKLKKVVQWIGKAKLPEDRNARIGFYIDAYNALVIDAVIDNSRPRSVLDVKGFFKTQKHKVAGQTVTLDELEKKVLNPYAKDPRTHMVLVCGAIGCPILEATPYLGSKVDARMDRATRRYLKSRHGAVVASGSLKLSKIFDWYKADFGGAEGVVAFVRKHLSAEAQSKVGDRPKVTFLDYNWTLNQQ